MLRNATWMLSGIALSSFCLFVWAYIQTYCLVYPWGVFF
mgnify:CR=1 FL=1